MPEQNETAFINATNELLGEYQIYYNRILSEMITVSTPSIFSTAPWSGSYYIKLKPSLEYESVDMDLP